jgi:hypothetical protein
VESQTVGVDSIITTDIRLADRYNQRHPEIKTRFNDMITNLPEAYRELRLSHVLTTATVLTFV